MKRLTRAELEASTIDLSETPELRAGTDFRGNQLYFTIPVAAFKTVTVGRGKAAKEVEKRIVETWVIRSDGGFAPYNDEALAPDGLRAFPDIMTPDEDRWSPEGPWSWSEFTFGEARPIEPGEIFAEVRAVFHKYLEYASEAYYDIAALYTIGSYLFRLWGAYPYIHLNGTRSSGKSQTMRVMVALGLNGINAGSISPAALLRTAAGRPGLMCIDEAEQINGEKGEDLRLLLNGGYQDSGKAIRAAKDGNDNWFPVEFPTYGPKVMGSINPLEPTLQSRCVVVSTAPAIRDVPAFDGTDEEWRHIRNRLYCFALDHAPAIYALTRQWQDTYHAQLAPTIISRGWEITQPLIVLADYCGGRKLATDLIAFFLDYFVEQQRALDEVDRTRTVLKSLPRVLRTKDPVHGTFYLLKDIHEVAIANIEEDAREKVTTRTISRQLHALGFRNRQTISGGTAIRLDAEEIRAQFAKRRVEPFAEDAHWLENPAPPNRLFDHVEPVEPVTRKAEFDALDLYLAEESA